MLRKRWHRIIFLAVAIVLYVIVNMLDYTYTMHGIKSGLSTEGNPLAQKFIDLFGLEKGLLIFKINFLALIISSAVMLEIKYCQQKRVVAPSTLSCRLLFFGVAVKMTAVGMWLRLFLGS